MPTSRPYEEPSVIQLLTISGFVLVLNVVNFILDLVLYCGLVGQIFIGVLFGTPGLKLLDENFETCTTDLGYLGLILSVYEGGLSTPLKSLVKSTKLSTLVALTGIALPIALSFILLLFDATPTQCFAAGASLSATSLGTIFTTISNAGLSNTSIGVVLTSAAMFDDVIGLIMLQIVTELNKNKGTEKVNYAEVIARPLGVSLGFLVLMTVLCRWVLPTISPYISKYTGNMTSVRKLWSSTSFTFIAHTMILFGAVTAGDYAGTSQLFTAFLAGVFVEWWSTRSRRDHDAPPPASNELSCTAGINIFDKYYRPSTAAMLRPFFFASIGFSIPITQMFQGRVIWKGLIYSLLMFFGKAATGFWIWLLPKALNFEVANNIQTEPEPPKPRSKSQIDEKGQSQSQSQRQGQSQSDQPEPASSSSKPTNTEEQSSSSPPPPRDTTANGSDQVSVSPQAPKTTIDEKPSEDSPGANNTAATKNDAAAVSVSNLQSRKSSHDQDVLRAYGPLLLGTAMTARGEIGFLIASVAASHGVFNNADSPSNVEGAIENEFYLIVVWAIVLCTVLGPVGVGALVRRIRRLSSLPPKS